jgi:glycosyltransferase involved in cell wall biosynthesis
VELARPLAGPYEVSVLDWHAAFDHTFTGRVKAAGADMLRCFRRYQENELSVIEMPMLHRPLSWAAGFNTLGLQSLIKKLGIDIVINGSYYLFCVPRQRAYRYIVDVADLPADTAGGMFERFIDASVCREIVKADAVTASSRSLVDYVHARYGARAHFIPNGADFERFKNVSPERIEKLRNRYGFAGKWVIGHIGHMGAWVDVEFMVRVFQEVKKSVPESVLWMVGSSPFLKDLQKKWGAEDVIFTGPVAVADIESYFMACDIGVLPSRKSLFQDLAFHIKLIEYAAARKIVVASDLEEIKKTRLPHVLIAPLCRDDWVRALLRAKDTTWQASWDEGVRSFDWKNIALSLRRVIEEAGLP